MKQFFRKSLWVALAMVSTCYAIESVQAQRGGRGGPRGGESGWSYVAKKYDADKDGTVTLKEYTRGETAFKTLDANSDGVIDASDWKSSSRPRSNGDAPVAGDAAPDFSLTEIRDAESTVTLSDFTDKKAVALIFGSCT